MYSSEVRFTCIQETAYVLSNGMQLEAIYGLFVCKADRLPCENYKQLLSSSTFSLSCCSTAFNYTSFYLVAFLIASDVV